MKFFTIICFLVQAVLIQNAYSQIIRAANPIAISAPMPTVVAQPSVANTLADTLSLLTVSSLLSETLPLNPNMIAVQPMATPIYGGCGCGCGWNNWPCNNYGYIY